MMYDKYIQRRDHKKYDRVARKPIGQSPPAGTLEIFLHRERPDIARAAPIQVARGSMVQGVLPAPVSIRRQIQQSRNDTRRVVGSLGFKERRVAAVVENNEDPGEKAGGKNRDRQ